MNGSLVQRNYREGAAVHKGDVLFEIDARPLNAVLTQARAQLAQAEAQLAKSARDVERDTPLAAQQAIAQSQLDTEIQAYRAAGANVQSLKAGVETAQLNVGFTSVTWLIDGVAAIATAQIGDLVGRSSSRAPSIRPGKSAPSRCRPDKNSATPSARRGGCRRRRSLAGLPSDRIRTARSSG